MEGLDEILQLLKNFVNMDSGSNDKCDTDKFVSLVEAEFKKTGMKVERICQKDVGDFLQCTAGHGSRKILLLGHMDTVFPSGTAAKRPFSRKDNLLYGPGVLDMKGGIAVILFAVRNVIKILPEDTELIVFLNSDEETGSIYSRDEILKRAKDSFACLSFESAKPGTLTTERKGIVSFNIDIHGVSAHSGVNYEKGRSAIEELTHKICSIYSLADKEKEITVNTGIIRGGDRINIVASHATAGVEIRYFNIEDEKVLKNATYDIVNTPFIEGTKGSLRMLSDRPPLKADARCNKLFNIAKAEAEILGRDIKGRRTGGGGDASFASSAGIPAIDGLGPEGENSHTNEEFVIADSLPFKVELASRLILDIAKGGI